VGTGATTKEKIEEKNRRCWSELEELGEGLEARSWGGNEEGMEDRNKERDKEKGDKEKGDKEEEHGKGMGKSLRVRGVEELERGMGKRDGDLEEKAQEREMGKRDQEEEGQEEGWGEK
jgi:hypothetical protein